MAEGRRNANDAVISGKHVAGAIGGAVVAGLGLTAMMMLQERKTGKPSELIDLERASAAKLGDRPPPATLLPSSREQTITQGGHLLLSAMAGAAYAFATDEDARVVPSGITFGLAFYGIAHWLTGPALGVKQPEWRSDPTTIGMHAMNHVAFGLVTAVAANAAGKA